MSDSTIVAIVWLALAAHLVVAVLALRRRAPARLIPAINLAVALCVLAYWAQRWYGYLAHGITWYATDQLVPLYALGVGVLAALTLRGRLRGRVPHALAFGAHTLVLVAAAAFVSLVRFDRMF